MLIGTLPETISIHSVFFFIEIQNMHMDPDVSKSSNAHMKHKNEINCMEKKSDLNLLHRH